MSRHIKQILTVVFVVLASAFVVYQTGGGAYVRSGWEYLHNWVFGSSLPPPILTNESDIAMMSAVSSIEPNPFGTFQQSLAALPTDIRKIVLAYHNDDKTRRLTARAWSMTKKTMRGDADEIEPFLAYLEQPLDTSPGVDVDDQSTEPGWARGVALYGLNKALLSDAGYGDEYPRMRAVALAHISYRGFRENAATILYLLDEISPLDQEAKDALDKALEHPLYRQVFMRHLKTFRKDFSAGKKG